MPHIDCVVSTPIYDSFRVQQVAGMFEVTPGGQSEERFSVEVPAADEDWQIGAIVGPSGSGKSTVARQAFGAELWQGAEWPHNKAVVDAFAADKSIKDITEAFTAVGFSSPPSWLKPYHVLSNGEKFRCELARAIVEGGSLIAFDEFTSVVDRTVAKIGSAAVSKAIRRGSKKFIAVTCHYDVVDWLEPDWVLDMASGRLARGRLWRRPKLRLEIRGASHRDWPLFARHHYLDAKQIHGVKCYVAELEDRPVCFVAVGGAFGHPGMRLIRRVVTLPDYQGIGIAGATVNAVAKLVASQAGVQCVRLTTGHPAMMRALKRNKQWRCVRFVRSGSSPNLSRNISGGKVRCSAGRAVAAFQYVGSLAS